MSTLLNSVILKSDKEKTDNCRENPAACLGQVVVDGCVIVMLFGFLSYTIDAQMPSMENSAAFLSVWVPVLFLLKAMELEYADQLARVAGFTLATKIFAILTTS